MMTNKKGHNTIEYIMLLTAVIVVCVSLLIQPQAIFPQKLNETYTTAANAAHNATNSLFDALLKQADNSPGN